MWLSCCLKYHAGQVGHVLWKIGHCLSVCACTSVTRIVFWFLLLLCQILLSKCVTFVLMFCRWILKSQTIDGFQSFVMFVAWKQCWALVMCYTCHHTGEHFSFARLHSHKWSALVTTSVYSTYVLLSKFHMAGAEWWKPCYFRLFLVSCPNVVNCFYDRAAQFTKYLLIVRLS